MNTTETNIFRIENLEGYSAQYRLHPIRGLAPDDEDYFRNLHTLSYRLARELRTPATFLQRDGKAFVVLRSDAATPKSSYSLVRATAVLDAPSDIMELDFSKLDPETRPIALRFLTFVVQGAFWKHHDLWQPHAGGTFFEKSADAVNNGVGVHRGFLARVIDLGSEGFGVCVDVRHKYVSIRPLPVNLSRKLFNEQFKTRHAIYHYGRDWFQIRLEECNDLSVTEHSISADGKRWTLLEYVLAHTTKPHTAELANLPKDCSVVHYFNGSSQKMAAPSALCFPVFDTESPQVRREHARTIIPPHVRLSIIDEVTAKYLRKLKLDGQDFSLSAIPVTPPKRMFGMPDLEFGHGRVLTANGTPAAIQVGIEEVGKKRIALLRDKSVGFFSTGALQQQFFLIPQSIYGSWGPQFLTALAAAVDAFYPLEHGFSPRVISYNDSRGPTWVDQAQAIIAAAREAEISRGFAVIMLHQPGTRQPRKQDQLAAYVTRKFFEEFDIRAATMHSETGSNSYTLVHQKNGSAAYLPHQDRRSKLDAYLRVVALNKVLLSNEKWPFVLAQPLYADVTVGVDIKSQHVGFTLIGRGGRYIDTRIRRTRFREQLRADEFEKHLFEIIKQYHEREGEFATNIVIHRDGRMFETERFGAAKALTRLKENGFVAPTAALTCVEIGKHSYTSVRLFDVRKERGRPDYVRNPHIGQYFIPTADEGYLVSTGYPFDRVGTVLPLHVRRVEGPLPMEKLLQDIFWQTTLAWSRPDDCSRYPVTIKINDRRLFEDAGEYDEIEIELQEEEATS